MLAFTFLTITSFPATHDQPQEICKKRTFYRIGSDRLDSPDGTSLQNRTDFSDGISSKKILLSMIWFNGNSVVQNRFGHSRCAINLLIFRFSFSIHFSCFFIVCNISTG